jgi:tetratricopeptide (TPR) repeat protein
MKHLFCVLAFLSSTTLLFSQTTDPYFNRINPLVKGYDGYNERAKACYNHASVNMKNQEYQEGFLYYSKALDYDPKWPEAYNNRGIARCNLKDNTGAIEDFTQAIKIAPEFAMDFSNRGVVKITVGNKDKGCADLKTAISLGNLLANELILKFCQ